MASTVASRHRRPKRIGAGHPSVPAISDAAEAHRALLARRSTGKLVLDPRR